MAKVKEQFALTNPISIITGKEKEEFTREDILEVILKKNIERITFHYTAIDGKLKEVKIPVTSRQQIELVLTEGERVDGSSLFKGIIESGKSDLYIVPVYKTAFFNPFDEGSLDFMCRLIDKEGKRAWFAPDNILHNAINLLESSTGYQFKALAELEFYIIGDFDNSSYQLPEQKGYHATAPFAKSGPIVSEMLKYITQIFGNVKYAHNEVGYLERMESDFPELKGKSAEQVEIEFLPTELEEMADCMVISSWIIRNVAYKHDFTATFFPKIEIGHAGNGLHIHMKLIKDGESVMTTDDGELSQDALKLIGGLCHYAPSLTAFGNMVSASYLRLVPNQEAPTKVCWSNMNRNALIRVPLAWRTINNLAKILNPQQKEDLKFHKCRQTVELRSPDGSANAHLLLAGLTMAAQWGLTNPNESLDIANSSQVHGESFSPKVMENYPELATSCMESAENLLQVRNLYEREDIFPSSIITYIAQILENENDRGLNNRLMSLPETERHFQSRRIMHRDLHKH